MPSRVDIISFVGRGTSNRGNTIKPIILSCRARSSMSGTTVAGEQYLIACYDELGLSGALGVGDKERTGDAIIGQ